MPHDKGLDEKTPLRPSLLKRFNEILVEAGFSTDNVIRKKIR